MTKLEKFWLCLVVLFCISVLYILIAPALYYVQELENKFKNSKFQMGFFVKTKVDDRRGMVLDKHIDQNGIMSYSIRTRNGSILKYKEFELEDFSEQMP